MDHAELSSENLKVNRLHILKTLRMHHDNNGMSAELTAIELLEIRHQFLLPFMAEECQEGPYRTLSNRIIRIAVMLMGREWVEDFMENQKKHGSR